MKTMKQPAELAAIRNLGPASVRMLAEVGVTTRAQLEALGAVAVYRRLRDAGRPVSLNLVYAIEAGLADMLWTELPHELRQQLKRQVEASTST